MTFGPPITSRDQIDARTPTQNLHLWFAAGYLYEHEAETLIPDPIWDYLCGQLIEHWDAIDDPMRALVDHGALCTATASYLAAEDYPPHARGLAEALMRAWFGADVPYRQLPHGRWAEIARQHGQYAGRTCNPAEGAGRAPSPAAPTPAAISPPAVGQAESGCSVQIERAPAVGQQGEMF